MRVLAFIFVAAAANAAYSPDLVPVTGATALRSYGNTTLYSLIAPGDDYGAEPVYLIDVKGDTRYDMGFAYGSLLAREMNETYHAFFTTLLGDKWYDVLLQEAIAKALMWQWNAYLGVELPQEYRDELAGIAAGSKSAGFPDGGSQMIQVLVLGNTPSDLKDWLLILLREYDPTFNPTPSAVEKFRGMCSMIAAWGSRTQDGKLFSGRNLDWTANTGINKYKLMTVFHPPGKTAHVTFGYVMVWGALAGMSASGVTVHEANLEEAEITFSGFPWLLRLRYIMENADTSAEARALWAATNNTAGFNFMVTSANDAAAYNHGAYTGPGVASVFETMYNYTAVFSDNDPREAAAMYPNSSAPGAVYIGFPMPEALWRTNNGFDPVIRAHFEWDQAPDSDSQVRYQRVHDILSYYHVSRIPMDLLAMANITSLLGDKGQHPYVCTNNTDGSNVLSVAFAPSDLVVAAAWERNNGTAWRPAACSSYLVVDMKQWF